MKRIAWVLLVGLWCGSLAIAQIGNFSQRGKATQELAHDGISIAHPSLPLNSKATVTNTRTGKSVEATVTGRVPASASRIADLSSGAWNELGLDANSEITITTVPAPRPRPASPQPPAEPAIAQATPPPETPPAPAQSNSGADQNPPAVPPEDHSPPAPPPRPAVASPPPQQPPQNYAPDPDLQRRLAATAAYVPPKTKPQPPAVIQPQVIVVPSYNLTLVPVIQTQQMITSQQAQPAPVYQPPAPVQAPAPVQQPVAIQRPVPAAPVCASPTPLTKIRVIPGYPDPNCGKIYKIQVGAYSTANAADKVERMLRSHGFNVTQELCSPYYRVMVSGVPASTVYATVQRLEAIGIEEVIIR